MKPRSGRTIPLYFKVSPEEKEIIEKKMAQLGIHNQRAYLRKMAVDGYAVRSEDIRGAVRGNPAVLKVAGCIYAGDNGGAFSIKPGEAYRIMTGAPFPEGADTAVKQEDTDYGEE